MMKLSGDHASKQPIFRQLDEKHLASETEVMKWSPKMDLIAIANVQGEVTLHRLSWQKVWTLSPPTDSLKVLSIAWRPDGKVLAIGYSSDVILLCDTENKDVLHVNKVIGSAVFMQWTSEVDTPELDESNLIFKDDSLTFLPKLPPLNKNFGSALAGRSTGAGTEPENGEDSKKLIDQKRLNILIAGTDAHSIHFFAFGVFPFLQYSMKLAELAGRSVHRLCSAFLSDDFTNLFVIAELVDSERTSKILAMLTLELPLLASRRRELYALSMKYGQLASLLGYVSSTIQSVLESWEDILLEIDTKLVNYAKKKHHHQSSDVGTDGSNDDDDETVADDFLELLMFGTPSDELQTFLLHDLTEKGLKKVVHSIELSYSNIQKLVLKHLQNVGQAIVYHLADVLGMARWYDRFGVLGLDPEKVDRCLSEAGAFMLKVTEVQQVIDQSMKNLKVFFRWLYVVILRLSDEQVSGEITKITQQELHFVAHFLKDNFSSPVGAVDDGPNKGGYNLERVGQYLRYASLSFLPDLSKNLWVNFLESRHTDLKDDSLLYRHPTHRSLVQQHYILKESVQSVFDLVSKVTGRILFPYLTSSLTDLPIKLDVDNVPIVQQSWISSTRTLYNAFSTRSLPCDYIIIDVHSLSDVVQRRALKLEFNSLGNDSDGVVDHGHDILDFQFYNDETMSVLLIERGPVESGVCRPILVQLPLRPIIEQAQDISTSIDYVCSLTSQITVVVNGGRDLHSTKFQPLTDVKALKLAVSGPRHVVCVLFESKRRVRLFEMDIEEDDDEDDDEAELSGVVADDSFENQAGTSTSLVTSDVRMGDDDKENSF